MGCRIHRCLRFPSTRRETLKLATRAPAETHSDYIRLSRRPLKSDGGSFSRATSHPFNTRSPAPVRASRRSIGKTLGPSRT